jgi:hypothetical protein
MFGFLELSFQEEYHSENAIASSISVNTPLAPPRAIVSEDGYSR